MTLAEDAVEASGTEALEIECTEGEACSPAGSHDFGALCDGTIEFRLRYLDQSHLAVMANPKIAEAQISQRSLGPLD